MHVLNFIMGQTHLYLFFPSGKTFSNIKIFSIGVVFFRQYHFAYFSVFWEC
jgi:hypothetical protein